MNRCYLVCYDIRDEKRLSRVHRVMKGYGDAWQYSVFFFFFRDIDRVRMQTALEEEMNLREDRVLIIDLGVDPTEIRNKITVLGESLPDIPTGIVII